MVDTLSCHMLSVTFKCQRLTFRPRVMLKINILGPIFAVCEDILMRLIPFCRGSHCIVNGLQHCCVYSCGAMSRSILSTLSNWDPNLEIGPITILVTKTICQRSRSQGTEISQKLSHRFNCVDISLCTLSDESIQTGVEQRNDGTNKIRKYLMFNMGKQLI